MKLFNIFKKEEPVQQQKRPDDAVQGYDRSFKAAIPSRFTTWFLSSFNKINADTKQDLKTLITRCRDLAKNNEVFRSHLNNIEKSIIGNQGFRLQSLVKTSSGVLDDKINEELERAWYQFGKRSNGFLTEDGLFGDIDFDTLILRTLITDGQVFIKVNRKAKNPYGISFSLIDALQVQFNKNRLSNKIQNAIVAGVQIDKNYRPVKYYYRDGDTDNYQVGVLQELPASDVIHIFKHEFVGQVRGFPEVCSSIDSLKQLDDYAIAELLAAKVASCQNVFYERNGQTAGDWMDQNISKDKGTFVQELSPGESSIVPQGYTVKSISPNHPNTNFGGFVKAIVRRIASSVGVSYNRLAHDYEAVNYSSLREASIDEGKTYSTIQRFMIQNWKELEYKLFVQSYITNNVKTKLKPTKIDEYLNYSFIPRKDDLFDPAKDIIAVERRLKLGLTNPIIELERRGMDVDDLLDGWAVWQKKCKDRNLTFNTEEPLPLDAVNQFNEQATNMDDEDKNENQ